MGAAVAELSSGADASGAAGEAAGTTVCGGGAGAGTAVGPWIWPSLICEMALSWARIVVAKASMKKKARAIVGI